jgi:P2 family phage contractile tail tube protein
MALMPNQTNNFRVYADGALYIGIAEVTLPNIVNQTDELRGGALAGPILVPVIGHFEDFTLTMTFFAPFPGCSIFLAQTSKNLAIHSVVQYVDTTSGAFSKQPWNYLFTCTPKEFNPGRLQQGGKPDMTISRTVTAYQIFDMDSRIFYADKMNMICEVDGEDFLAQDRAWL